MLDVVGDGIRLTEAGFLPVAAVKQVLAASGAGDRWHGWAPREATTPVWLMRRQVERFGLLAHSRGRLVPTPAARALTDDVSLLTHVLTEVPPLGEDGGEVAVDAQVLHLLAVASGRDAKGRRRFDGTTFLAEVLHHLGYVEEPDRAPLAAWRFVGSLELLLDHFAPEDRPPFARALLRRTATA